MADGASFTPSIGTFRTSSRRAGSSRTSRRTSPGAWRTAPRMVVSFSIGAGAEDLLGDGHGGHGLRPAGIEGQVGDRLDKLLLDGAILLGQAEVEQELLGAPTRGQRRDGHE